MTRIRKPPLRKTHGHHRRQRSGPSVEVRGILLILVTVGFILYRQLSVSISQQPPVHHEEQYQVPLVSPSVVTDDEITETAFADMLQGFDEPFDFFETLLPKIGARPLKSDVVELRHCHLGRIDYATYTAWATVILQDAWPKFELKLLHNVSEVDDLSKLSWDRFMVPEFALGLLEVWATHHDHCDFNKYPLEISDDLSDAAMTLQKVPPDSTLPRLAIVIVAFKDIQHLERLVKAVYMPHYYFVIHLERKTPQEYVDQVKELAEPYSNVVVIQFGTVTYRTDSVSMINYRIMNWLVHTVKLEYDYHLTMGGAVYPLYSAKELALHLQESKRDVWLGELLHDGSVLGGEGHTQWNYLTRKRLIFTAGEQRKYQQRTKKSNQNGFVPTIPDFIQTNMTKKTNSGNQAVFSYKFVKELTMSAEVKHLFALAKYGCCCCLEERTWITAARIIGYKKQALEAANMFQVWGGGTECKSSMNNAILSSNASLCFKNEDATNEAVRVLQTTTRKRERPDPILFHGDKMLEALKDAKKRGFMFARKFKSDDSSSMELLDQIEKELHL